MSAPGGELAPAALTIARIEYPTLDRGRLPAHHRADGRRSGGAGLARGGLGRGRGAGLNQLPLRRARDFAATSEHYDDPRNSFLNEVLDRRTGIPISLAIVYIEVARRAGLRVDGVNFPGHFLLRVPRALGAARRSGRVPDRRSVPRRRACSTATSASSSISSTPARDELERSAARARDPHRRSSSAR